MAYNMETVLLNIKYKNKLVLLAAYGYPRIALKVTTRLGDTDSLNYFCVCLTKHCLGGCLESIIPKTLIKKEVPLEICTTQVTSYFDLISQIPKAAIAFNKPISNETVAILKLKNYKTWGKTAGQISTWHSA